MVRQYELFQIEEDRTIEKMFPRFQNVVSRLRVLNKSYNILDHVMKTLRSLSSRWRPIMTPQLFKKLKIYKSPLEELLDSLQSQEIELNKDESKKKSKSFSLNSKSKKSTSKALQRKTEWWFIYNWLLFISKTV